MAFDAYLRFLLPPVDGEVTLDPKKYEVEGADGNDKWISIEEYGFSATMPVTQSRSGGTGAATTGKGKLEPFTFKKPVDATSMYLAFHAAAGTVFKKIVVNVFASIDDGSGAAQKPHRFLTVILQGAVIGSCAFSGGGGDDLPTEDVSINYGSITYKYSGFKVDEESGAITVGDAARNSQFNWNTITNSGTKG